jgi:hypothetical protein
MFQLLQLYIVKWDEKLMNGKWVSIWKETVMAGLEVLFWNLSAESEGEKTQ